MKILGIDTSSGKNFAIGLYNDGKILELNFSNFDNTDSFITYALKSACEILEIELNNIDYFAAGVGPGSFTGLRIGVTIIKTLAWATKRNVIPISSLELLISSLDKELIDEKSILVPVVDARTGKLFCAIFDKEKRLTEDMDIHPQELKVLIEDSIKNYNKVIFVGNGFLKYRDTFKNIEATFLPEFNIKGSAICKKALEIITLSKESLISAEELEPKYLRKSEAEIKKNFVADRGSKF